MNCPARIHPLPNDTIIDCEQERGHAGTHVGVLRNYAYEGSATRIVWLDTDRRTFTGEWIECPALAGCVLPANHRGDCAT